MIQRIQSVYLLIAALLIAALFFVPFAELSGKDGVQYLFNFSGIYEHGTSGHLSLKNTWPVAVLIGMCLIMLILTIFQFKNRNSQIKLSYLCFISLLVLKALLYYFTWSSSNLPGGSLNASLYAEFPAIAAILVFLAIRGIRKDENLVKSIDRIR